MEELFSIAKKLEGRTQSMEKQLAKLAEQQQSTEKETMELEKSMSQANHTAELDEVKAHAAEALKAARSTGDDISKQATSTYEMQNAINQVQAEIDQESNAASSLAQITQDLAASFSSAVATSVRATPIALQATRPVSSQPTRSHHVHFLNVAGLADTPKERSVAHEMPAQLLSKAKGS